MARYREKDETDLVWNRVRRRITRELDTAIQDAREEVLNALLSRAWEDYVAALGENKLKELEGKYSRFVTEIAKDIVPPHLTDGRGDG